MSQELRIEIRDDGWVILTASEKATQLAVGEWGRHRALLLNEKGFPKSEITEACRATFSVTDRNGFGFDCREMAEYLEKMFEYFDGPGCPSSELLEIRERVRERYGGGDTLISLWDCAFLDIQIRSELADIARSDSGWDAESILLHIKTIRDRHVNDLVKRAQKSQGVES